MAKLHLSLTLPGAVSLGSYEGGALAALLVAAQSLQDVVVIDSIAAASAGSITGLLTACCLAKGRDPVSIMSQAWVELDSLRALRTHEMSAPLSAAALSQMAVDVLGDQGGPPGPARPQDTGVRLSMALASLAGLEYRLARLERETSVDAVTYVDWYPVTIDATTTTDELLEYAQAAIASGSNAIGFPPKVVDRTKDRDAYERAGIIDFPDSGSFWYTDGGTIDNEPLGQTIDIAPEIAPDEQRVFVLIHPEAASPQSTNRWQDTDSQPGWLQTAMRALSISRTQSIYDDLKRLEKTNSHLVWTGRVPQAVFDGLGAGMDAAELTDAQRGTLLETLASSLAEARATIEADHASFRSEEDIAPDPQGPGADDDRAPAGGQSPREVLADLLATATGLSGKSVATVEVISPALGLDPGSTSQDLLAGAFLFHFGGFMDVRFRQSDFALGYRNMQTWLTDDLSRYLPSGYDLGPAITHVRDRYDQLDWDGVRFGGASFSSLSLREKEQLLEVAGHTAHVAEHDLRHPG